MAQLLALMDGLAKRQQRDRHRGHQPAQHAGPGAAPAGPVRPGDRHPHSRPPRPRGDPGDPQPRHAAGRGRGPGPPGRDHARLRRRRPGGPLPRGGHDLPAPHPAGHRLRPARIPYEQLAKLEVRMDDFLDALREVEPSAIARGVRRSARRPVGRRGRPGGGQAAADRGGRVAAAVCGAVRPRPASSRPREFC